MCHKYDTPQKATQTWKPITVIEVIKFLLRICRKDPSNTQDSIASSALGEGCGRYLGWFRCR